MEFSQDNYIYTFRKYLSISEYIAGVTLDHFNMPWTHLILNLRHFAGIFPGCNLVHGACVAVTNLHTDIYWSMLD
jgi:hypothetical protein